jgi:hypothetical protein
MILSFQAAVKVRSRLDLNGLGYFHPKGRPAYSEHEGVNMKLIGSAVGRSLLVVGLLISAGPVLAAKSDNSFAAFWTQFKAAVERGDQKSVSAMIAYPVFYNDPREEADFPLIWKGAFKPAQRACLAKQKPVEETPEGKVTYSVFCGEIIYTFGRDAAGWKLTDFGVND